MSGEDWSPDDWSQDDWKQDHWEHDDSVESEPEPQPETPKEKLSAEKTEVEEEVKSVAEANAVEEKFVVVRVAAESKSVQASKPVKPTMSDQILLGVDNGLDAFGKNVKQIFYAEMESSKQLKRSEILGNVEQFHAMILQFFGVGSPLVERCIGREILRVFELPPEAGLSVDTALAIIKRHPKLENK